MKKDKKNGFELNRREFMVTSGVAITVASCDDSSSSNSNNNNFDAGDDSDITDDIIDAGDDGDSGNDDDSIAPPVKRPVTTVKETIRGTLLETSQIEDLRPAFGRTEVQAGEPWIDRDDLNAASVSTGATGTPSSLAYFVHFTDIHLVDEESPARSIHSPIAEGSAWRPQEPWSTHILNASFKTINEFSAIRPMDFVVFSGDITDNKHYIELKWFIDLIEGNIVNPDTGDDDDPLGPGLPDPHDEYQAEGLDPAVKWFATQGNHDLLAQGNFDTLDFWIGDPTGDTPSSMISDGVFPTCLPSNTDSAACINDYCYGAEPDRCFVPAEDTYYDVHSVVPDANRHWISREEWIAMIMGSTVHEPAGHGFTQNNLDNGTSYWRVDNPIEGLPIALLGLDTSSAGGVTSSSKGYMSDDQLAWLSTQLDELAADNKLIIIAMHHCSRDFGGNTDAFRELLHNCPNVILNVTGHHHENEVMPWPAPSGMEPWHGYWEIQNSGLLDWPQQMRFYEVVDSKDGTGIIYSTMVNPKMEPGTTVEAARFYALADVQNGVSDPGQGEPEDRNIALKIAWPPSMIPILAALPHRDVESLHFAEEDE